MGLNHLHKLIREEIRTCLGIFHKRQKTQNSCETTLCDSLITPQITWMVTNMFIISLGDRGIHLSTAWWGACSRTHAGDPAPCTRQDRVDPTAGLWDQLLVFGRGFPASLDPTLSGWLVFSSCSLLALWKELPLQLS